MRRGLLVVASLAVAIAGANAAELSGTIKSIDYAKDAITLANGMTFVLPKSLKPADLNAAALAPVLALPSSLYRK